MGSIGDERLLLLRLSLPFCFSDAFLMMPAAVLSQAEAYPLRLPLKLNLPWAIFTVCRSFCLTYMCLYMFKCQEWLVGPCPVEPAGLFKRALKAQNSKEKHVTFCASCASCVPLYFSPRVTHPPANHPTVSGTVHVCLKWLLARNQSLPSSPTSACVPF